VRAFYESGLEDAAGLLGLTKQAFAGALMSGARSLLGQAGMQMAKSTAIGAGIGGVGQGAISAYQADPGNRGEAFLHGAGQGALAGGAVGLGTGALQAGGRQLAVRAERGIGNAINANLKPQAANVARQMVKGVPRQIASDAAMGAGFGALTQGAMEANSAPEGQGASAFMSGAAKGALTGGGAGAIMGATGRTVRNATGAGMKALAARPGMGGEAALKATQARGLGATLRDVAQPGRAGSVAPMGRGGAVAELGARAGNVAGEWVLPNYLTPAALTGGTAVAAAGAAGTAAQPDQYKAAEEFKAHKHPAMPDPVTLATMAGSGLGAGTTGFMGDLAEGLIKNETGHKALRRFSTVPGAVAGAALGHYLGKSYLTPDMPFVNIKPLSDLELTELRDYNPPRS